MDKTAIEHWSPVIGGQFWWSGSNICIDFCTTYDFCGQ